MAYSRFFLNIIALLPLVMVGCSNTGPVTSHTDRDRNLFVLQPRQFQSPLEVLDRAHDKLLSLEEKVSWRKVKDFKNPDWLSYLEWYETVDILEAEQNQVEDELIKTGQLVLEPGRSYSFDLDSFCVDAGKPSPFSGDGMAVAATKGPALKWLPVLLQKYSSLNIPQWQAQLLVWALTSDVRFDELAEEDQNLLLKIFPDARVRFGNRQLENTARSVLDDVLPEDISSTVKSIEGIRESFLTYQHDFKKLSEILAPKPGRTKPLPIGWMKTSDRYFMKLTSSNGYSNVHVDIYTPEESGATAGRATSSLGSVLTFIPWKIVGIPNEGQRLALSSKANKTRKTRKNPCSKLEEWRPQQCRELTEDNRIKIIKIANPKNFPKTRYALPPKKGVSIEEETDCSHFTQEIYRRAGLDYPYAPTSALSCVKTFKEVNSKTATYGDFVVFPGHVGILEKVGA